MQNYDRYYEILDLPAGAPLEEIQRAWRLKAQIHPDIFIDGALREAAERKLALVNNARDELRKWWQANGCAPPTFKRAEGAARAKRDASPCASQNANAEDKGAAGTRTPPSAKPSGPGEAGSDGEPLGREEVPKYPRAAKPFGPPAFEKTLKHRIYDWCLRPDSVAAGFVVWPLGFIVSILPAYLVASLISALIGVPLSTWTEDWRYLIVYTIMWIAGGIGLLFITLHDFALYKELENPFVDMVALDAAQVINRFQQALQGYSFDGRRWSIGDTELGGDGCTLVAEFKLAFAEVALHARTLPAQDDGFALVTFWFEVKAGALSKMAEYKLVSQTAEVLRSSIGR